MKKNLFILLFSLFIVIIVFVIIFLSFIDDSQNDLSRSEISIESSLILFTGETCSHCKDVESYIYNNNLLDKIDLSIKEVYNDLNNAQLFEEKFNQCTFQPRVYGVPFLWHSQVCILGPAEIINYLNNLDN